MASRSARRPLALRHAAKTRGKGAQQRPAGHGSLRSARASQAGPSFGTLAGARRTRPALAAPHLRSSGMTSTSFRAETRRTSSLETSEKVLEKQKANRPLAWSPKFFIVFFGLFLEGITAHGEALVSAASGGSGAERRPPCGTRVRVAALPPPVASGWADLRCGRQSVAVRAAACRSSPLQTSTPLSRSSAVHIPRRRRAGGNRGSVKIRDAAVTSWNCGAACGGRERGRVVTVAAARRHLFKFSAPGARSSGSVQRVWSSSTPGNVHNFVLPTPQLSPHSRAWGGAVRWALASACSEGPTRQGVNKCQIGWRSWGGGPAQATRISFFSCGAAVLGLPGPEKRLLTFFDCLVSRLFRKGCRRTGPPARGGFKLGGLPGCPSMWMGRPKRRWIASSSVCLRYAPLPSSSSAIRGFQTPAAVVQLAGAPCWAAALDGACLVRAACGVQISAGKVLPSWRACGLGRESAV